MYPSPLSVADPPGRQAIVRHTGGRAGRRRLISLTPLVDVVFILLVFFMLASSFVDWRAIDLTVPTMPTAGTATEPPWLVDIGPDGLRLAGEPVSSGVLAARVNDRLTVAPDQRVLVRPASGVPLQDAVDVLGTLATAGVRRMSLIEPVEP
ncbi:MAG: biopolymer transporter ExbD [Rhodospirillales bacterium]|nr:MAG: biopolymer transporter ExbD [Rhodospirillales bacterium]